ncbi:hypothetical protein DL98DRAFT_662507 [Cadophora sp. DSE1049]|nr:hypothetical protein DL98DRAFT_662507 [Cadophora sp. DSE1049]
MWRSLWLQGLKSWLPTTLVIRTHSEFLAEVTGPNLFPCAIGTPTKGLQSHPYSTLAHLVSRGRGIRRTIIKTYFIKLQALLSRMTSAQFGTAIVADDGWTVRFSNAVTQETEPSFGSFDNKLSFEEQENSCVAVAIAKILGYSDVRALWKELYGKQTPPANQLKHGMDSKEVDHFLLTAANKRPKNMTLEFCEYPALGQKYPDSSGMTAYQAMCKDPSLTELGMRLGNAGGIGYLRPNGRGGHCVVASNLSNTPGRRTFTCYQQDPNGIDVENEVKTATKIIVFGIAPAPLRPVENNAHQSRLGLYSQSHLPAQGNDRLSQVLSKLDPDILGSLNRLSQVLSKLDPDILGSLNPLNPNDCANNCVSITTAKLLGYEDVNAFWVDLEEKKLNPEISEYFARDKPLPVNVMNRLLKFVESSFEVHHVVCEASLRLDMFATLSEAVADAVERATSKIKKRGQDSMLISRKSWALSYLDDTNADDMFYEVLVAEQVSREVWTFLNYQRSKKGEDREYVVRKSRDVSIFGLVSTLAKKEVPIGSNVEQADVVTYS